MRQILSYIWWPLLMTLCIICTQIGLSLGHGIAGFNLTYLGLAVSLFFLERAFPHEKKWLENDGQVKADFSHTFFNKGIVQVIVVVSTLTGVANAAGGGGRFWPMQLPTIIQVPLALVVMEFGLYWKHRLAHETNALWRFHAVHHSAPRLWFFNTGRFHFMDTLTGLLFGLPLLFLLGAPDTIITWAAGITAYIGMLTHCNVEMRFGFLSKIFNTPELHRWHHSRKFSEGNSNYGENLVLWDQVFGTYFRDVNRRPPVNIGISHKMPEHFFGQLTAPFAKGAFRLTGKKVKKSPVAMEDLMAAEV